MLLFISVLFFFFFKQKTAYEMRISDWSSDVCSSDLRRGEEGFQILADPEHHGRFLERRRVGRLQADGVRRGAALHDKMRRAGACHDAGDQRMHRLDGSDHRDGRYNRPAKTDNRRRGKAACKRSEEHTSELQSLMRISYAVFCLKK